MKALEPVAIGWASAIFRMVGRDHGIKNLRLWHSQ
jgi:hypothetical protein